VTEVVVDLLEAVDVEEKKGRLGIQGIAFLDSLLDPLEDEGSVRGSGQVIVGRLMTQLDVPELALGEDREVQGDDVVEIPEPGLVEAMIGVDELKRCDQASPDPYGTSR